jgi:hypothetical protein
VVPTSRVRQRRRSSPRSNPGDRRPQMPQRSSSRAVRRTDTTNAPLSSISTPCTKAARSIPSSRALSLRWGTPPPPFRLVLRCEKAEPRSTAVCAPPARRSGDARAPTSLPKKRGGRRLSSAEFGGVVRRRLPSVRGPSSMNTPSRAPWEPRPALVGDLPESKSRQDTATDAGPSGAGTRRPQGPRADPPALPPIGTCSRE